MRTVPGPHGVLHFLRQELATTDELERLEPRDPTERPWLGATDAARIALGAGPGNVRRLDKSKRPSWLTSRI